MHKDSLHEGHEVSDISPNIVYITFVILAIFTAVGIVGTIPILRQLETRPEATDLRPSPLDEPGDQDVPAGLPLIQGLGEPKGDRLAIEAGARKQIESYGWTSQQVGLERAHIPIEEAINLVAEGKLPYRQQLVVAQEVDANAGAPTENGAPAPAEVSAQPAQ